MKICISFIDPEIKDLNVDVKETDLIDTIPSLLSSKIIINNCDYDYVYNKAICEFGKTFKEYDFEENCKIYAIKKSEKPLKRQLTSETLNSILNFGSTAKKLCLISSENYVNQTTWKNESLSEIQSQMTKIINEDPSLMKSLLIQPQVEDLINNPSSISAMFAANPMINETITNHPDQVKFFSDVSQYTWVRSIIQEPKKYDNIMENYPEYLQQAMDSKRFRRMTELFDKTVEKHSVGAEEEEIAESDVGKYESRVLQPIIKSPYARQMIDVISANQDIAETVLKSCPYGPGLSEASLASIQNVMPAVTNQWKLAMEHSSNCDEVLKYLCSNPIELDEKEARVLEEATGNCQVPREHSAGSIGKEPISHLMQEISNRITGDVRRNTGGCQDQNGGKLDKEMEILNEMGFTDNSANIEAITGEHGNLNRAVYKLIA